MTMTSSVAARHYRRIFDSRSPEQLRVLAHIKRFMERMLGDSAFRRALGENPDNAQLVAERCGIDVDPGAMLPLWHSDYRCHRDTPECARWPLAVLWDEYIAEMLRHRELMREEGDMADVHPRFHAWRKRQMQRCASELGGSAGWITHPIIAFELSDGCTVGCWFCGVAADRFRGHYAYSDEHARLWRGMVGVTRDLFGAAARTGFCYWATDPIDNPDYDKFLFDYYDITGALPQTTTAAPLKDVGLTRRVMALFDKYRTITNRFSVLTVRQLDAIHATFSAEELLGVELIMQQKGSPTPKVDAGRAHLLRQQLQERGKDDGKESRWMENTTIACVSGFLVNLLRGRIQLITPVAVSGRWPLGYRILGERFFATVEEFRAGLDGLIDEHMRPGLASDQAVRFRRDLAYEQGERVFWLAARRVRHTVQDNATSVPIGPIIARGENTASEVLAAVGGGDMLVAADLLDQLFDAGLLEEDFDDSFAGARNEGLVIARRDHGAVAPKHRDPSAHKYAWECSAQAIPAISTTP
jgi:radical SAM family RiPP maturation amino acid epimerase